jgi:hypothetical protein
MRPSLSKETARAQMSSSPALAASTALPSDSCVSSPSPAAALSWSPCEAFPWLLGALACAVLITQFFEYAVVAMLYRLKWHRGQSHQQLCLRFYQVYWASACGLLFTALLWLYVTDRWAYKAAYGLVLFVVLQALQLSVAILLTSWQDMRESLQTQRQHPWLQKLLGASPVTKKTVS